LGLIKEEIVPFVSKYQEFEDNYEDNYDVLVCEYVKNKYG